MKAILPLFRLVLMLAVTVLWTGCEVSGGDAPGTPGNATWQLCHSLWQANYTLDDGAYVTHQMWFNPDGTGGEDFFYDYPYDWDEAHYRFLWRWASGALTSIELVYDTGEVLYMDNIYLHNGLMSCLLDGDWITFHAY